MNWVVAIVGLILIAAWIEQTLARRWRARRWMRRSIRLSMEPEKWWKDPPNDEPEGDY